MKKIGLFLLADATFGGTMQYNLMILDAVANLPIEEFEIIIGYKSSIWDKYLQDYSLKAIKVPRIFFAPQTILKKFPQPFYKRIQNNKLKKEEIITKKIQKIELPPIFIRILYLFQAKFFLNQKCDLWLFPSQDNLSYQVPVPNICAIHDLMHRYESQFPEVSANGVFEMREEHYSNICKYSRGILVDSEVGRQQVYESYKISKNRIFVLPFIPPKNVYEAKKSQDFEKRYKLPKKFIFYPANFWKHKNHVNLVKAIRLVKKQNPDIHLVLVGSKKNGYEDTIKLVNKLDLKENIHFMGYVADDVIPQFYLRSRALIMPTFFGPTNIPPLEAFALNCPVAISRIYGIPEQVGDAALLFDPSSIEEIRDAIIKLWTDDVLISELIEKGRERLKQWGPKQFYQRLYEIINKIIYY